MKVHTTQRDLLTVAKQASAAINPRSPIAALSHVRMLVNGSITVTATDMDMTVTGQLAGRTEGEGAILVPGKLLSSYAAKLPAGDVTLTHEGDRLLIEAGRSKLSIPTLPDEDFPRVKEIEGGEVGTFTESDISRLKAASIAASTDEFRPAMCGVHLDQSHVIATDGFRMVRYRLSATPTTVTIPANAIHSLSLLSGEVEYMVTDSHIRFTDGDITVSVRLIDDQYPNYHTVIPVSHETTIRLDRIELLDVVARVSVATNDTTRAIDFDTSDGGLKVSARDTETARTADEQVIATVEGPDIGITFNAKFLTDALSKLLTSQTIEFQLTTALKPATIIDPANPDDALTLLMPIRRA